MTTHQPRPKKIAVTLEVANDAQAMELNEAWAGIISGSKLERAAALDPGVEEIMERARGALRALTIFDGPIFTLCEVQFPFRFPRAIGDDGKRKREPDVPRGVEGWSERELRVG